MRPSAGIPTVLGLGALVLSFLCLFAGYRPNFMETFHVLTLNVSRFGSTFLNTTSSNSSNPLVSIFSDISNSIEGDINDAIADFAEDLGLQDWYSAHLMDYCYGNYTPAPVANATVHKSEIHKDISGCSNHSAMFFFNAHEILQRSLNNSKIGRSLNELGWPDSIDKGLDAIRVAWKAAFIIYCIAIGLIGISVLASIFGIFSNGRIIALVEGMLSFLAFLAILVASAIMTAVAVKGASAINKHGKEIGVEGHRGGRFLAITWAATGAMLLAWIYWTFECIVGHRRRGTYTPSKVAY